MNSANKAEQLYLEADKADHDFLFHQAYRFFILAAHEYDLLREPEKANLSLVRAALCLEKSQDWRAHSALWEHLGNRLGNQVNPEHKFISPERPGQSGMYHIISWEGWEDPENNYYRADLQAKKRHQQAWAYLWGAEESEAGQRFGLAAYLFRKAAISWELTKWGDRENIDSDNFWTKERLDSRYAQKWKLAATCYFRATYNEIQSSGGTRTAYVPSEAGWGSNDMVLGVEHVSKRTGDIDRMIRCWDFYGKLRGNRSEAIEEACQRLLILQDRIARVGRRGEAATLYRLRQELMLKVYAIRKSLSYPFRWIYYQATGSGTSLGRTLLCVGALYVLIFPLIYLLGGWLQHADVPMTPVSFGDAVLFSLANAVTLSVSDYVIHGLIGAIIQTLEAVSAYFVLGYVIWLMLRSFEE